MTVVKPIRILFLFASLGACGNAWGQFAAWPSDSCRIIAVGDIMVHDKQLLSYIKKNRVPQAAGRSWFMRRKQHRFMIMF